MKTILLLRHAKSSWKHPELEDHERPLNRRGSDAAPRMGALLADRELVPDHILSSTAVRARDTAARVAAASGYAGEIELASDLYLADAGTALRRLRALPEAVTRVLVVAHNPGLEQLLAALTGRREHLPTAALAHLVARVPRWRQLAPATSELASLWRPKQLADAAESRAPDPTSRTRRGP